MSESRVLADRQNFRQDFPFLQTTRLFFPRLSFDSIELLGRQKIYGFLIGLCYTCSSLLYINIPSTTMAQTAMSRLFLQSSSVRQSILRPAQVRNFGSNAVIPTFTSTPSTELNEALQRFREEVFIPCGLPVRQQKSVFKPRHAKKLETEPIVVKISETEDYTLTPKKRHELPTKKEAMDVLHIMVTAGDFSNLIGYVSGLKMSGYVISNNRWEYIIRKASMAGKLNIIYECARQGHRTGLSLADQNVARILFFELHQTATRAKFQGKETSEALSLAQDFAALMQGKFHSNKDVEVDPKHQPFVIATLLELATAKAMAKAGPVAKDQEQPPIVQKTALITDYAQKLDASWSRIKITGPPGRAELVNRVRENLIVLNAMRMSLKWPKASEETQAFQARVQEMEPILVDQLRNVRNGQLTDDLVAQKLLKTADELKAEAKAKKAAAKA
ncbi:unnamed protein product [Penicillium salamii]|uniref:Uncharacterized protein n=1 Tax=Penicillium salamii TaxID=1612424 RepID=A0A9W4NQU0_9EURO|nr:unnamed protein product [Penicillium salamii]CAG8188507.1 unnamed protein product [Penicillium salamii]CAG8200488.1 unnamed protein product [Penicillium salamii]CAG8206228.1 unnamed protein product [Penicillium salamii]CAG8228035.1 unnamed protein product [Penicillium salamii]